MLFLRYLCIAPQSKKGAWTIPDCSPESMKPREFCLDGRSQTIKTMESTKQFCPLELARSTLFVEAGSCSSASVCMVSCGWVMVKTCEWPGRNIISICHAFRARTTQSFKQISMGRCSQCHCNSQQLHDNVQASVSGSWFTETATGAEPHTRTGNVHWAERSESKLKVIATNPESLCHKHWCFSAESRPLSLQPLWTADQSPCLQHGFFPNARLVKSNLQQTLSAKQKCFSYWLTWQHQIALPRLIALGLACQPMPQIKIQMSDLLGRQIAYKLLCNRNVESMRFERDACLGPRPKHRDCASTFGPTRYDSTSIEDSAVFLRLFTSFDVYPWNSTTTTHWSNESNIRAEAQI